MKAEYSTQPEVVIVHDPTPFGALDQFDRVPKEDWRKALQFLDKPEGPRFKAQHRKFFELIQSVVPRTVYLSDLIKLDQMPDGQRKETAQHFAKDTNQVYTRDGIITLPWAPDVYIEGRMKHPLRALEPQMLGAAAEVLGLRRIAQAPPGVICEGGDVIPFAHAGKRILLVGYPNTTTKSALDFLDAEVVKKGYADMVMGIELAPWRVNLDGGMTVLADDVIIANLESLQAGVLLDSSNTKVDPVSYFRDLGFHFVSVAREHSWYNQLCNVFCLGQRRVILYDFSKEVVQSLEELGVKPLLASGGELVKGLGGPRCMTRPIYKAVT